LGVLLNNPDDTEYEDELEVPPPTREHGGVQVNQENYRTSQKVYRKLDMSYNKYEDNIKYEDNLQSPIQPTTRARMPTSTTSEEGNDGIIEDTGNKINIGERPHAERLREQLEANETLFSNHNMPFQIFLKKHLII
jgi:hypothetical protein